MPGVFPVGYSNDLLWHDPNLAEGLPVNDTPFVVGPGRRRDASSPTRRSGSTADVDRRQRQARRQRRHRHRRRPQLAHRLPLKLQPFRCYHVSVRVKTDNFSPVPRSRRWPTNGRSTGRAWGEADAGLDRAPRRLQLPRPRRREPLFRRLGRRARARLQWKDWKIEEAGLVNVLRRPGTPLRREADGDGRVYREGTDFEPIKDPRTGNVAWPGDYDVWHEPPPLKTKLPEGTKLRVSWYHPVIIYDDQVCACIAEPKTNDLLADQAKRMKQAWGDFAAGWMMSHDEFRTLGWCKACRDSARRRAGCCPTTPGSAATCSARRPRTSGTTCSTRSTTPSPVPTTSSTARGPARGRGWTRTWSS